MPHIMISAFHAEKNVKQMNIDFEVQFKKEYFDSPKMPAKMKEFEDKLEALVKEYFEEYDIDSLSNHQYNQKKNYYY